MRRAGSIVAPQYESGSYYQTYAAPDQDADFKCGAFLDLFLPFARYHKLNIRSYADVGCGGGGTGARIARELRKEGHSLSSAICCDVFAGVESLVHEGVDCVREDFCKSSRQVDLVTLMDVVEHVPHPVGFLRDVSERCRFVVLHLPLDNNWVNALFDRFRPRLSTPGHILLLDAPSAISLMSFAGLSTMSYTYTHGYDAPSGSLTGTQRIFRPIRSAIASISPWLGSRTVGGVSLMLLCVTPRGLECPLNSTSSGL